MKNTIPAIFKKFLPAGKNQSIDNLKQLNLKTALIYAILAVAVVVLSADRYESISTNFLNRNIGNGVFSTAYYHLFDVNLVWLLGALLLVPAIANILFATRLREAYGNGIKHGYNRLRWIEQAICSAILMVIVALVVGVTDASTLLLMAAIAFGTALVALAAELRHRGGKADVSRLSLWTAIGAGLAPWLVIALYVVGAWYFGGGRLPWYVYAVVAVTMVMQLAYAVTLKNVVRGKDAWEDHAYGERRYIILGFLAKVAVAAILFAGILYR
jgi:hypothetical protein